jgi:predicted N-acetyltransferase YhbS
MEIIIRKTDKINYYQTENLTREAFWNLYRSGCDEHLVLHQLRESNSYVEELDLIAIYEGEIIGHVISTKAHVIDTENKEHEVLCVGPIAILPEFQNKGIGTKLLDFSISVAGKLGYTGMILFGNPDYYHRFGFRNAQEFGITTKEGLNFEPFMVLVLQENGMEEINGKFYEAKAFTINEKELDKFEKKFPEKIKGKPKIDLNIL